MLESSLILRRLCMELAGCWYEKIPSLIFFFPF